MLRNRLYYMVKPLIPRRAQLALRRRFILSKMSAFRNVWPIDEKAGIVPEGWLGWPEGKKFALVLTHDVETAKGQENCRNLIELEKELEFRSSFNFVPKRYDVSPELRKQLIDNGFEVGVHGLYHDGKYYSSRKFFLNRAEEINQYMREWGSVGYRAPSMLHKLEWFHDLEIEYDASTFDSDPFEPTAEGMHKIFPFIVNGLPGQKGYVELPYTLPQDFTLFCLMRERNIDIWKKKLDWIVEKGGTALINVHPDYMNFDEEKRGSEEYPAHYYREFLEYLKDRYKGQYWHVLPRELSRFWINTYKSPSGMSNWNIDTSSLPMHTVKPRILMIVENAYPSDSRVRKEATALKDLYDITVISLKRDYKKRHEMVDGVEVFRIPEVVLPMNSIRNRFVGLLVSLVNYALQYAFFTCVSAGLFMLTHIRRRYKVIHAHNPPDTLFLVGLLGKLFSIKYVYDHHDLTPELYLSRYGHRMDIAHKILLIFEKLSCKLADVVIATNKSYKELEAHRHGVPPEKIYVVRNDPVMSEYRPAKDDSTDANKPPNKKNNLLYIGSINPQDGVEGLIDALKYLVYDLGEKNVLCRIVGDGDSLDGIKARVNEFNLMDYVEFTGYVYDREKIIEYLAQADIGVEPAPDNPLNRRSTFIKIMEYMAAGKPFVAFDLPETRYSAGGSALFASPGDIKEFAVSIKRLFGDTSLQRHLGNAGLRRVSMELTWEKASSNLLTAYRTLSL